MKFALSAARVITGDSDLSDAWIIIEGDRIVEIGQGTPPIQAKAHYDGWLIPGFVDVHVHGGGGGAFDGPNPELAVNFHKSHGTTTMLASLVSAEIDELKKQIVALLPLVASAQIAGIHLEGPFISPHRCGAHDLDALTDPSADVLSSLIEVGQGKIRMITFAPELIGGLEAIPTMLSHQIVPAIGHTEAGAEVARKAFALGAHHITHLFNAMPSLSHRESTLVAEALADENVVNELILDTHHVVKETAALAIAAAPGRWIAVTDAMSAAGLPDGEYQIGSLPVESRSGVVRLKDGGALAGSTLTMDRAFNNILKVWGRSPLEAVQATSTRPAKVIGRTDIGRIAVGARADLVEWSEDEGIGRVMSGGVWLTSNQGAK